MQEIALHEAKKRLKNIKLTFKANLEAEDDENEILRYLETFVRLRVAEWLGNNKRTKVYDIKAEFVEN